MSRIATKRSGKLVGEPADKNTVLGLAETEVGVWSGAFRVLRKREGAMFL
jgi:hypothetical protein